MKSAVIGGGSWGTALASVLTNRGPVQLWARSQAVADGINTDRRNPRYQSDIELPDNLTATSDLEQALAGAELVCVVVPSHALRAVMTGAVRYLCSGVPIVSASKGIENETLQTMEEVLTDVLPRGLWADLAFLSGPSFAKETLQRMPTAVTIAARFHGVARQVQSAFSTDYFRCYTTEDVTGVELGGALKNVIAIAAGMASGLGLGHNARAGLLTRGLHEISRLAVARGANPLTLAGLAGMGDLVLTCTGDLSRNRRVGVELGAGRTLDEILADMSEVAEGVRTARSAYNLAKREGVEMPIGQQVYEIIYEGKSAPTAMASLMGRRLKRERDAG